MGRFGHESFRPRIVSAGSFRPRSFRPDFRVGRFGLIWWVVSAPYTPAPQTSVCCNINETAHNAPVICNHVPRGPGNSGDIDFSMCKAQVKSLHCRDLFWSNPWYNYRKCLCIGQMCLNIDHMEVM